MRIFVFIFFVFITGFYHYKCEAQNQSKTSDPAKNILQTIDSTLIKINKININDVDMIMYNDIVIDEIETKIWNLNRQFIKDSAENKIKNFAVITTKLRKVQDTLKIMRTRTDELIRNLDLIYYCKGLTYLENNMTDDAINMFEKSVNINSFFILPQFELLKHELNTDKISEAIKRADIIFNKIYTDKQIRDSINIYVNKFYINLFNKAKIQYQKENFHESLKDYQDALDMCLNIKILNCDKNKAEAGIRNSMLGIYNSFLFISRKAISKNVPELAFNYGSIALKYQKDNYKYVKFDGQPQDILYLVVNNYIAKINYDLQKKMFSAANYFLTQIKNVCDTLKEDNCYQIHKKLNSKIKSAMNIKETKTPDTSLKNQPVLITKEQTSTANQCKEVRKSVDELYRKGNFYALEDNYQYALSSYDEALNIALQNITCIMDLSQLRRNRDSIIKPATYLNNLAEIQNMITSKDYDTAFYKYLDLEKYYKNNNLKKYGFNHNPILNFILYQKDESFILTSVKNFIKIKRYQDAISTLDRLRQYKFDNKLTKEQQTLIANAIAATDYLQNPRTLPDQNIKIYISDENWFKVFVKSYKKKWEQLKK